jgi:hypothetical protein
MKHQQYYHVIWCVSVCFCNHDFSWVFRVLLQTTQFHRRRLCRPSGLLEVSGSPEEYWLVCGGLLTAQLFNLNFIFFATAHQQGKNEQHILRMYSVPNRSISAVMEGCRASRLE